MKNTLQSIHTFSHSDQDAIVAQSFNSGAQAADICQSLQCRSPHRDGYYFAGPALTGTSCSEGMWCDTGRCVRRPNSSPAAPLAEHQKGGWSAWQLDECESGCLRGSMGFQRRRRRCDNPVPVHSSGGCEGSAYDTVGCDDVKVSRNTGIYR